MKRSLCNPLAAGFLVLLLFCAAGPGAYGNDAGYSYQTLKGLAAVTVSFKGFHSDFERYGVDERTLRPLLEARLRAAGLEVVGAEQAVAMPGAAQLLLDLHVNYSDYHYYSYSLALRLNQKIPLPGNPQSFVSQTVWTQGINGTVLPVESSRLNGEAGSLLERFLADYRAQNPAATPSRPRG